jgi:hypothetical protein
MNYSVFVLFSFILSTISTAKMHTTTPETKKKYNSSSLLQQLLFETNPNNVYGLALLTRGDVKMHIRGWVL